MNISPRWIRGMALINLITSLVKFVDYTNVHNLWAMIVCGVIMLGSMWLLIFCD